MMRGAFERRLRDELHAACPPRAAEAEQRAWRVVRAAQGARMPVRQRHHGRRIAVAVVGAAAILALALSPAGAQVGDWIGDVVSPAPEATRSSLTSLPAEGRLLVVAGGAPWIVDDDGARRRLGDYRDASWSPGGLFVAAARRHELIALETDGDERWTRPAPGRVTAPRWSPDGFRIAYRAGADLWVAVGDNSDNWLLARGVRPTPPAWRPAQPAGRQVLAYARGARVEVASADPPRRILGRTPPGPAPRELWWSADGRRLVVVGERAVRIHDARGRLLRTATLPGGLRIAGSVLAPGGRRLAAIASASGARSSELLLVQTDRRAPTRRLLGGLGRLQGMSWSIDGSVLVVGLPAADQWLFVRAGGPGGLRSVERIRDQFGGNSEGRTGAFPRPAGWCYAEPAPRTGTGKPPCSIGAVR